MEARWEEETWFSWAGDTLNWSGVKHQDTRAGGGHWGFGIFDDFQSFYPLYSLVLASCDGSNLDVEKPTVFREDAAGFGQTVVQFGGSR